MFGLEPLPLSIQTTPAATPKATASSKKSGNVVMRLIRILLRRWWQIAIIALVVCVASAKIVLPKFLPSYKAESAIIISPYVPRVMYMSDESRVYTGITYYEDYIHNVLRSFSERRILDVAIKSLAAKNIAWLGPEPTTMDPVDLMRARLTIELVRNTSQISVSTRDTQPSIATSVVNEVVSSCLQQVALDEAAENNSKINTLLIENAVKKKDLTELYVRWDKLTERLGSAALDMRQNVYYDRSATLNSPLNSAYLDRLKAEADEIAAQKKCEMLQRPIPPEMIRKALDTDLDVREMRTLFERQSHDTTVATSALGPDHPLKIRADEQMRTLRTRLDTLVTETRDRIEKGLIREQRDEAERVAIEARAKRDAAVSVEQAMRKSMEKALKDLADFGIAQVELSKLKTNIDRLAEGSSSLEKRIEQLQIESRAPGRIALRSAAEIQPDSANKMKFLAALGCAAAGLFVALVSVLALDVAFPILSKGKDLSLYGIRPINPVRVASNKPEAWIELVSQVALLAGRPAEWEILSPNGLGDTSTLAMVDALSKFKRGLIVLEHDPKLGLDVVRDPLGNSTRLRLNLAAHCSFAQRLRELDSLKDGTPYCVVLRLDSDPLLIQDLHQKESFITVVLATPTRQTARLLNGLYSVSCKSGALGAIAV